MTKRLGKCLFFLIYDNCIVTSFAGLFSFITIFSLVIFGPRSVSASKSESSLSFKAAWKNWIALVVKDSGSRWFNKAGVSLTFSFKGFQRQVLLDNFTSKIFPGQVLPDKLSSKRFAKQVFPQKIFLTSFHSQAFVDKVEVKCVPSQVPNKLN